LTKSKKLEKLNQIKPNNKDLEVLLFFIDEASSSTLVETMATHDYENKTYT